ncbi:MAG: FecR domain-containing protein [Rhizobiaceae bacterium]
MRIVSALFSTAFFLSFQNCAVFAQPVGTAAAVNQNSHGTPPNRSIRTIVLGDKIIHNERIETDAKGLLQILLADGTTFTVGPDSHLTIDSFVYDPDAGAAKVTASLGKGIFRFIGGKTSKTPDGVRLNTPVGTVGIRGAIADMAFDLGNGTPSHIDLSYGDGITLWRPDGKPIRLYKAGFSIVIEGSTLRIHRTPEWWTGFFQELISGANGEGGGAPIKPNGAMVVASGIPNTNSDVPLPLNSAPIPTWRPNYPDQQAVSQGNDDIIHREAEKLVGKGETAPMRVLTVSSEESGDGIVSEPVDTTLTVRPGGTTGDVKLSQGVVTLPVYNDTAFATHSVDGITSPFGTLSGVVYSGRQGFAAYILGMDGDPRLPFYAITGTPTDMAALTGNSVRHYSFTPDPIQGIGGVPFMSAAAGIGSSGVAGSDFLIAEPGTAGDGTGRVMQSWVAFNGTGASQQSAIGVNVGALDGSGFTLERRGSYRAASDEPSSVLFGQAATLTVGGAGFFGTNGQNFVVSDDAPGQPGHFFDSPSDSFASGTGFSTIHVGNLTGEVANPTRSLSGTYQGFAAGVIENASTGVPIFGTSSDPSEMAIAFDPARKSLGGSITVDAQYYDNPGTMTVAFGDGINGNTQNGASAYIDSNTFAATANPNATGTHVSPVDSSTVNYQRDGQTAGTYFVSGTSANLTTLGVSTDHLCTSCDFLKWGWWGTQVQTADPTDPSVEGGRFSVHLGTWVAGDIANDADIANSDLANATGTFKGMAVGNVVSGGASYVAAGNMDMTYNFGERSGELNISNFDGRSFGGTMNGSVGGQATFHGDLSGSPGFVGGSANGAFVNNGSDVAAGAIGNFEVGTSEGDWRANGVFAGGRTSVTPNTN